MFDKFGEFDSADEINRAAAAQLKEGDLDAIKTIEKTWEEVYGEEFPKKEEIAPVQPKKRKESKVVKAKPERSGTKPADSQTKQPDAPTNKEENNEEKEENGTPRSVSIPAMEKEPKKTEEATEVKTEIPQEKHDETQIPGQTELTKDFPEYCPPDMNISEEQPEEVKGAWQCIR